MCCRTSALSATDLVAGELGVAREAVGGELVVVACLMRVPVPGDLETGGAVERAGGDIDPLAVCRLPEEARAALAAEAAAGVAVAAGLGTQRTASSPSTEKCSSRADVNAPMYPPQPAFHAMAEEHVAQRAAHLVATRRRGSVPSPAALRSFRRRSSSLSQSNALAARALEATASSRYPGSWAATLVACACGARSVSRSSRWRSPSCSSCSARCGGSSSTSSETTTEGACLFNEAGCAGCHSLTLAGARARVGPDLDAVKPSYAQVAQQVRDGGGGMPAFADELSESDIAEIASFVSSATGGSTDTSQAATAAQFTPDDTKL